MSHRHRYHARPTPTEQLATAPRFAGLAGPLPASVDLRSLCLPIRDQGPEGACSGMATAALREYTRAAHASILPSYLSPAFLYWRTRLLDGTFPADSGATLGDELKTLANYGVCFESDLPYSGNPSEAGTPFNDAAATVFKAAGATLVNHADPVFLKQVFAAGQAIAFVMPVHQSFEDGVSANGLVPIPGKSEAFLGYHALFGAGFFDSTGTIIVRNSWGTRFGDEGYCYLPYEMVLTMAETWTIPNQA